MSDPQAMLQALSEDFQKLQGGKFNLLSELKIRANMQHRTSDRC